MEVFSWANDLVQYQTWSIHYRYQFDLGWPVQVFQHWARHWPMIKYRQRFSSFKWLFRFPSEIQSFQVNSYSEALFQVFKILRKSSSDLFQSPKITNFSHSLISPRNFRKYHKKIFRNFKSRIFKAQNWNFESNFQHGIVNLSTYLYNISAWYQFFKSF